MFIGTKYCKFHSVNHTHNSDNFLNSFEINPILNPIVGNQKMSIHYKIEQHYNRKRLNSNWTTVFGLRWLYIHIRNVKYWNCIPKFQKKETKWIKASFWSWFSRNKLNFLCHLFFDKWCAVLMSYGIIFASIFNRIHLICSFCVWIVGKNFGRSNVTEKTWRPPAKWRSENNDGHC